MSTPRRHEVPAVRAIPRASLPFGAVTAVAARRAAAAALRPTMVTASTFTQTAFTRLEHGP